MGELEVPADALSGVHAARAADNFQISRRRVNPALLHAFGAVKLACAKTNHQLGRWDEPTFAAIAAACQEMFDGKLDRHIALDALQGGAGTSTNMAVNEVLANRALQLLGKEPGDYAAIHPLDDINLHQSTNDAYPTALKVAAITLLRELERALVALLEAFQRKEKEFADVVKVGRTQLQDAVLTTMGRSMSAYAEAFARDRWRVYKCEERLRQVNLGGTAIGTGLAAPRQYIFRVVDELKRITGFGLARAENLVEATQNADAFVEVSGILKACASNLVKVCGDLRFLSSGPDAGIGELELPPRQAGSSIMPGKVNPVIPEAATQAALVVMANDSLVSTAASMGHLELNPFMPLIAEALLESLDLLTSACRTLQAKCVDGLRVNREVCAAHVDGAAATLTALVDTIGYERAQELAKQAKASGVPVKDLVLRDKLMTLEQFQSLTSPEAVNRLGSDPGRKTDEQKNR